MYMYVVKAQVIFCMSPVHDNVTVDARRSDMVA